MRKLSSFFIVLVLIALAVPASVLAAAGATERVSVDSSGTQGNGDSVNASISSDGRYVAFTPSPTTW